MTAFERSKTTAACELSARTGATVSLDELADGLDRLA